VLFEPKRARQENNCFSAPVTLPFNESSHARADTLRIVPPRRRERHLPLRHRLVCPLRSEVARLASGDWPMVRLNERSGSIRFLYRRPLRCGRAEAEVVTATMPMASDTLHCGSSGALRDQAFDDVGDGSPPHLGRHFGRHFMPEVRLPRLACRRVLSKGPRAPRISEIVQARASPK
jgi:hypothetical protein